MRGQTMRELLRVESRWAEFASWTADNLGDSQDAGYWLRQALSMAREADDGTMATYILMRQAQRAVEQRNAARALALADGATSSTGMAPRDRALCAIRSAEASALAGQRVRCHSALQRAHTLVAAAEDPDDPDTIGRHCVPAYVVAHEGHCQLLLGQPEQAVTVLENVLRTWPAAYRQDEGLARTWLATAYAMLGRVDEAAEQGDHALTLALDAGSVRLTRALSRVDQQLAPHHGAPQAQRFRARYALAHQVTGRMS
ncbi:hypothetical protein [Micromonospora sp. DPT]|uniref:hypothetical protein n=1 Tax=Micromonospora sp. DPT TaxID=3142975 RepID=UPI00320B655E